MSKSSTERVRAWRAKRAKTSQGVSSVSCNTVTPTWLQPVLTDPELGGLVANLVKRYQAEKAGQEKALIIGCQVLSDPDLQCVLELWRSEAQRGPLAAHARKYIQGLKQSK
jgi:hypothetical protein